MLLVVLGVIIVGLAIAVSIRLFREHAIDTKRDLLTNECINMASLAMDYYKKPPSMGGGGRSFIGWGVPVQLRNTASGTYYSSAIFQDSVVLLGTGNEVVTGTDTVKVQVTVHPDSYVTKIIH